MEKVDVTGTGWEAVITSATTDRYLAVTQGAGVLCLGPTSGITEDEGIPVSAGLQLRIPEGVNVSAMRRGPSLTIVHGPYGV